MKTNDGWSAEIIWLARIGYWKLTLMLDVEPDRSCGGDVKVGVEDGVEVFWLSGLADLVVDAPGGFDGQNRWGGLSRGWVAHLQWCRCSVVQ